MKTDAQINSTIEILGKHLAALAIDLTRAEKHDEAEQLNVDAAMGAYAVIHEMSKHLDLCPGCLMNAINSVHEEMMTRGMDRIEYAGPSRMDS